MVSPVSQYSLASNPGYGARPLMHMPGHCDARHDGNVPQHNPSAPEAGKPRNARPAPVRMCKHTEAMMTRRHPPQLRLLVWSALGLLAFLAAAPAAGAEEPALVIMLTGSPSAVYAVGSIEQVMFDDDAVTIVTSGGSDSYPTEEIVRIDFLMDVSSAPTPEAAAQVLKAIRLFQNQPNPFSSDTQIAFDMPQAGAAELAIYSPDGRLVRTLMAGERSAGRQTVRWDGLDETGHKAAGGVYFYTLRAPGVEESRRMILLP